MINLNCIIQKSIPNYDLSGANLTNVNYSIAKQSKFNTISYISTPYIDMTNVNLNITSVNPSTKFIGVVAFEVLEFVLFV